MRIRTGQVTALTCRRSAQERPQSPYRQLATKDSKNQWTGTDMLMLTFEIARPEGEQVWLELDNVRFY